MKSYSLVVLPYTIKYFFSETHFLVGVQVHGSHRRVAVLADGQQIVGRCLPAVSFGHNVATVERHLGNDRHFATKTRGHSDASSHVVFPHAAFHQMGNLLFFIIGGQRSNDLVQQEGGNRGAERLVGKIFRVTACSNFRENTLFHGVVEQVVEFVQIRGVGVVDHTNACSVDLLEVLHMYILSQQHFKFFFLFGLQVLVQASEYERKGPVRVA